MRRSARTVLCGGRSAMIVPTATAIHCNIELAAALVDGVCRQFLAKMARNDKDTALSERMVWLARNGLQARARGRFSRSPHGHAFLVNSHAPGLGIGKEPIRVRLRSEPKQTKAAGCNPGTSVKRSRVAGGPMSG